MPVLLLTVILLICIIGAVMAFFPEMYRGEKFIGTSELAKAVETLLRTLGARQDRGTVSEIPDERTIRFYQSEGLIDPPIYKSGPASVFTAKHLLQLVAIKLLQSQDVPIKKIRFVMEGKSEDQLEELIEGGRRNLSNEATRFLMSVRASEEPKRRKKRPKSESPVRSALPSLTPSDTASDELLEAFKRLFGDSPKSSDTKNFSSQLRYLRSEKPTSHVIAPGIELRLDRQEIGRFDEKDLTEILKKITRILNQFVEKDP